MAAEAVLETIPPPVSQSYPEQPPSAYPANLPMVSSRSPTEGDGGLWAWYVKAMSSSDVLDDVYALREPKESRSASSSHAIPYDDEEPEPVVSVPPKTSRARRTSSSGSAKSVRTGWISWACQLRRRVWIQGSPTVADSQVLSDGHSLFSCTCR